MILGQTVLVIAAHFVMDNERRRFESPHWDFDIVFSRGHLCFDFRPPSYLRKEVVSRLYTSAMMEDGFGRTSDISVSRQIALMNHSRIDFGRPEMTSRGGSSEWSRDEIT